jgi:F-type H+-transporting ATPase subunit a
MNGEPANDEQTSAEGLSIKGKVLLGIGLWLLLTIGLIALVPSEGKNEAFQPQDEFKIEPWVKIDIAGIDLSFNKFVLYLLLAAGATIAVMVWISRRMEAKPNRVQAALEAAYDLTRNNITAGNLEDEASRRWFPFIASLFFFIWFSNMIGYLPLPTNTHETIDVFGLELPSFALYAATANISMPLVLTLVVWFSYHVEGVRAKGFVGYIKSFLPAGLESMNPIGKGLIFVIELLSHLMRLVSLSVRLFANLLAGHLLLLFMGGGLAVLLGVAALGALTFPLAFAFFLLEVGLIATLQALIFSTLTAIYLGGATAETH